MLKFQKNQLKVLKRKRQFNKINFNIYLFQIVKYKINFQPKYTKISS